MTANPDNTAEGDSANFHRSRSVISSLAGWGGWAATLGMIATAAAWMAGFAPWSVLKWVNAFTAYAYLPAYAILAFALSTRRGVLASCCGALVIWHLAVVLPTIMPARVGDKPARTVPGQTTSLRVFYASVGKTNTKYEELFDELRASEADVLVLTEFTEAWHNHFNRTELPAAYPYAIHLSDYGPAATGVFSSLPLTQDDRVYQSKRVVVRAEVVLEGTKLGLYALHAPRPLKSSLHNPKVFWEIVQQELAVESGPLLVIGDFNATPYSLVYRQLCYKFGLKDCHQLTGRGAATTWPNGAGWLPPIRIDHALVTEEIECSSITEGVGAGTDHKPLILDLKLPAR